jgi:hypothetical protein
MAAMMLWQQYPANLQEKIRFWKPILSLGVLPGVKALCNLNA